MLYVPGPVPLFSVPPTPASMPPGLCSSHTSANEPELALLPVLAVGVPDTNVGVARTNILLHGRHQLGRFVPIQRLLRNADRLVLVLVRIVQHLRRLVVLLLPRLHRGLHRILARRLGWLGPGRRRRKRLEQLRPRRFRWEWRRRRRLGRLDLELHRQPGHRDGVPMGWQPVDRTRRRRRRRGLGRLGRLGPRLDLEHAQHHRHADGDGLERERRRLHRPRTGRRGRQRRRHQHHHADRERCHRHRVVCQLDLLRVHLGRCFRREGGPVRRCRWGRPGRPGWCNGCLVGLGGLGSSSDVFRFCSHWGEVLMKDVGGTTEQSRQGVVVDWDSIFPWHGMKTYALN